MKKVCKTLKPVPARRPRVLMPGDWLVLADGQRVGFVWSVIGDVVEVRTDEDDPQTLSMTRMEASAYRIIPNIAHGTDRPFMKVRK